MGKYVPRKRKTIFDSFDENWELDAATGCFVWKRSVNSKGYGILTDMSTHKLILAHRFALERRLNRAIKPGMMAIHSCDNPPCVNEAHLREGTGPDNSEDARVRGRAVNVLAAANAAKTHCKHGHEFTPENTRIHANGSRSCRACQKVLNQACYQRRKEAKARNQAEATG